MGSGTRPVQTNIKKIFAIPPVRSALSKFPIAFDSYPDQDLSFLICNVALRGRRAEKKLADELWIQDKIAKVCMDSFTCSLVKGRGNQGFGSGFNQVSGSGSVFGIRIRIQDGNNDPQTCLDPKKCNFFRFKFFKFLVIKTLNPDRYSA